MKTRMLKLTVVVAAVTSVLSMASAGEILGTNTIVAQDPVSGGMVEVISTVTALPNRLARFEYEITNLSYEPSPGQSNGFSGLMFMWGQLPGPYAANGFAPDGWDIMIEGARVGITQVDFQLGLANGFGLGIGETGVFGFETAPPGPGQAFTDDAFLPAAAVGNSHDAFGPTDAFLLIDVNTGLSLLMPAPAPGGATLLIAGLVTTACRRRRCMP